VLQPQSGRDLQTTKVISNLSRLSANKGGDNGQDSLCRDYVRVRACADDGVRCADRSDGANGSHCSYSAKRSSHTAFYDARNAACDNASSDNARDNHANNHGSAMPDNA
jgi:hypothetical protein